MKKAVLLLLAVFMPISHASAEESYAERMQKLQQYQHSKPNAENYINSLREVSNTPVKVAASAGGHFYMPVAINGHEVNMMADTGASSIFISRSDAQSMGINMGSLNYNVQYDTANGRIMAAKTIAKELRVGDIVMRDVPITVSQNQNTDMSLLGMDFFTRLSKYEVQDGILILYK